MFVTTCCENVAPGL